MKHFQGSAAASALLVFATQLLAQDTGQQQQQPNWEYYNGRPAVAGELLVKFREGHSQKLRGDSVRMRRYQVREASDLGQSGYTHLKLSAREAKRTLLELAMDPDVEYVEPNYIVQADAIPTDSLFAQQWALRNTGQNGGVAKADIDATTAWDTTKGSKNNVIAVVDTGVDYNHPDLKDNMWSAPKSFTVTFGANDTITCPAGSRGYNAVSNTCDPKDVASHGTMVSGVIAAAGNNAAGVSGVNWTGSIMGLAFMNANGSGSVAAAIRAIEFAIQAKRALGDAANVRVLNNSWGGSGFSQALLDQIGKAQAAGMLFVAAAGNSPVNLDTTPSYPAAYTAATNLLAVAATDNKDAMATFSAFGAQTVHLGAPGVSIATTSPNNAYSSVSGTSFASPMTAGVAGLVLAVCPTLDTASLRKVILDNTDPIPALSGKTVTGGRLNAFKAVRACAASVRPPSFTLSAVPGSATLQPGATAAIAVDVVPSNGFNTAVTLAVSGLPAGVTGTFAPASAAPGTPVKLTLTAAPNAAVTSAAVAAAITGTSGTLRATAPLSVTVRPTPTFNLTATPATVSVKKGAVATFTVAIEFVGGFNSPVSIGVTGLPAGVSTSMSTSGTTVTVRITTTATTAVKSYPLTVTGTSGTLRKTASATLTVTN